MIKKIPNCCLRCKKPFSNGVKYKLLGIPFYSTKRAVCEECYKDSMGRLNARAGR